MSVIQDTQRAEIRRITVRSQSWKELVRPPSQSSKLGIEAYFGGTYRRVTVQASPGKKKKKTVSEKKFES
jgi:hypothetical protein